MKALVLATVLATVLAGTAAAAEPVRLGTEGAYPPYNFLDAKGAPQGIDIDIGDEICARLALDCIWVLNDWETLIPNLQAGTFDAILATMSSTPERRALVDFTQGYEPPPDPAVLVGQQSFIDVESAVIAVQAGTTHEAHLVARGRKVQPHPTARAAFDAMMDGQADLVFGGPSFLEPLVFRTSRYVTIVAREALDAGPASIAFRKGDPLRDRFDAALGAMKQDGSLAAIRARWLPERTDL